MFLHFMSESMGISIKELREMRTHRAPLPVKDLILPYINFKTSEFQKILDWYNSSMTGGLENSVTFAGIEFVFGEGGIHASWENKIFEADSEYDILDIDVTSFYPNLAM